MGKVKTGLRGLSAEAKLVKANVVLEKISGNPHFPNPEPSMLELEAAREGLKEAIVDALDRGRMACARKQAAVAEMDSMLTRLAAYVNSAALGDVRKLVSSGFALVKRPEPISTLNQPAVLRSKYSPYPGRVDLRWKRVPGALVYEVEISQEAGGNDDWKRIAITSRPQLVVADLVQHSFHSFRVRAIGTQTESAYSQVLLTKAS
jgi:hypothetical protein